MSEKYKKRQIFPKIIELLKIPETIVLHGSRQVGKTTLIKMTVDYLENKEVTNIFYFDLEKPEDLELCNRGVDDMISYMQIRLKKSQKSENSKIFVFIDEIQYLDNPSSLLKLFYDHHKNDYKLMVSGSSSFAIKSKFKDSLVGRIIDLEIFGLSFQEFLHFKGKHYNLSENIDPTNKSTLELKKLYREYAIFGFYPQVVLATTIEDKQMYLNGIIDKYINKDIKDLANIKNINKFNNLLQFLAAEAGQLVNISELSNTLNIARQTIEEYLFILENSYIIKIIYPFHKNIRSELTKMPKIYFEDTGILNILKNKKIIPLIDGQLFENSIYNYLRRKYKVKNIYFWRTLAKQEVDFILDQGKPFPLEVKIKYNGKHIKSLLYFGKKYNLDNLYCVAFEKNPDATHKNIIQLYPWEIDKII
jgi:uncharacterized protein